MAKNFYLHLRAIILGSLRTLFRHKSHPLLIPVKTIVIACQDRIGDMVMSLPALAAVRKRYPQATIICLAVEYIADMVADSGYVDKVTVLRKRLFDDLSGAFELRRNHPDLGIDLQTDYTMRNALLLATSNAQHTIGYNVNGRGLFYTNPLEIPSPDLSMVECLLRLSREAGAPDTGRLPELHVSENTNSAFSINHNDLFAVRQRLVGIHPGGHYETQRWPADRFAATADALIAEGASVVLIGGDREKESIKEIQSSMKQQPLVFVPLNLKELVAAISLCKVLLCNNSGPLHIASALSVPTVSAMGPTDASRWWPLGPRNIVLRKDLPCISCNSGVCRTGGMECMNAISVGEMVTAAAGFIVLTG